MRIFILIIAFAFISCNQKQEVIVTKKTVKTTVEKGEYFSHYTKKESSVLKTKTDTLNLFYDGNQLNRVEIKFYSESFGGDTPSGYERKGYHINNQNFLDATVYITDTLKVNNVSDYPREYEERYEFYRPNYTFSYISSNKKKFDNYYKSREKPSEGYIYDLSAVDIALSKIDFPIQKFPKSLYDIKSNKYELYASQDSVKVYEINNTNSYKIINSSIPFYYLRDIKVKKEVTGLKYFAKISLKEEGYKYIDLKEIEGIQVVNPHLDEERFVTAPNGLEIYDNRYRSDYFGNKEYLITKIPKGERVEMTIDSDDGDYLYIDGRKGRLVNVRYTDRDGESVEGVVFSGYLSINKL
ncbi:hypothetical protein GKZ90_0012310 [Flavobacterium sp. MC2016-06]|uniref:hypothetical protein n=1 Tax=Flavobacterium sp. MC2016-06 TaxID=2676308 RepID=UPI0012BAF487|nr:hypothetical protein [Flavobacterium sp. MC2016-06]MBU3862402.1 hypothetical protein [Flavobacterium sp. MC2016-06]